jgi:hypothetical protein
VVGALELREDIFPIVNMFLKDDPGKIEEEALIGEVVGNEEAEESGELVLNGEKARRGS